MQSAANEKGYTLIELMVVLMLIGILAGFAGQKIPGLLFDGKVEQMEAEAKILIRRMELLRNSAATTTVSSGIYNRTYNSLAAGSTVSDLDALLDDNTVVPQANPFGFNYEIEIDGNVSYIRSTVPGNFEYGFAPTTTVGGNTVIEFSSILNNPSKRLPMMVSPIQKSLYLEETRH